jgi:hypothetical protein
MQLLCRGYIINAGTAFSRAFARQRRRVYPKRLQCRRIKVKPDLIAVQNKYVLNAEENCLQMI